MGSNDDVTGSNMALEALDTPIAPSRRPSITVAVDPVALVVTECITVTSAMRKHARWAHSSVSAILGGGASKSSTTPQRRERIGRRVIPANVEEEETSRWGLRGKKGKSLQDNPLISAFARLRSDLRHCREIRQFDTPALLHPFLQVIRSSSTSAPITSLALIAITKFLAYSIIRRDSPRLPEAMQLLASAITHCRFEASDTATDEIVLLRILKLMESMISGPTGDILSDDSVCGMMECGLSMCSQIRLSELLRRSAEISMVSMCQVIFERLKHLEIEAGEDPAALDENTKDDMDTVKMDPSANGNNLTVPEVKLNEEKSEETRSSSSMEKPQDGGDEIVPARLNGSNLDVRETVDSTPSEEAQEIKPYSLPSIRELLRALVELLDPHDRQYNDTMRVTALRIVDVALEVAGPSIANHPSLAILAKDTLCRHLFQLVRSENMAILNESLRVAGTLLSTCRGVLKLQQELYLSYLVACLFPRVDIPTDPRIDSSLYQGVPQAPGLIKPAPSQASSGRSTPVPVKDRQKLGLEGGARKPDAREAMVENVGALVRIPSFMAELFVNYDCETDRSDLCMDMVGLLARNAFPDSATWSTVNVPPLCLDALLGYVQSIADRLDDEPTTEGLPDIHQLREQRARKKIIIRGATKFNEKPKAGLAFLASQGIIKDPDDSSSIAHFLKGTSRVDKKVLGEFISKKSNESILNAFMDLFDFAPNQRVDEALRWLLNSFRLPGESQLIERIIVSFSEQYFAKSQPEDISDKDAVYVLVYAVIMLNTDQHNPNVKSANRMSVEDFSKNLRGVNGGKDFAPEFLQAIYNSIKTREIILPEEHDNKNAYDHAWKELLIKVQSATDLIICDTNIYDADMFDATWKPIIATLSYVFLSATDDAVFSRVVTGFDQCAQIAAKYQLSSALDHIVSCLAYISSLAPEVPPSTSLNTEVQVDKKTVMVSETAVRFGRDWTAQLATVTLFRVIHGNETTLRTGWNHIVKIVLNLFVNSLIPPSFPAISSNLEISPIPLQPPAQVIDRDRQIETGLFSAFTSYVSSFANDEPPEPSEQEIEYTLCTVDTVNDCEIGEILANISEMPVSSLKSFVLSLLALMPEDTSPRVIVVKPEVPAPSPIKPNGGKVRSGRQIYDPTIVFILELATTLTLRDSTTVEEFGKDVADALQTTIRDTVNIHPVVISRAVYYLLHLLRASNEYDFIRAPVILHTFSSFEPELLQQCASHLLKGISACVKGPASLRMEMANSPDFWSLLHSLGSITDASGDVFQIIKELTGTSSPGISSDNYEASIALLDEFASAASVATSGEPRRDRSAKRGKEVKSKPTQHNDLIARGTEAMTIIFQMTNRVPQFIEQSHLETNEAWNTYWSPIFRALSRQCLNPCREIRYQAFTSLQRSLLSNELVSPDHKEWTKIFTEVLFPLITQLLKPEVFQSDPVGMSETRVRAATLLCKVFLHYLVALSEWDGMLDLWLKIIAIMDRLMNSGQGDNLEEAVSENLKNILLVMSSGGYLAPPEQKPEYAELWNETWKRLDRFLPHFFAELFPEVAQKPRAATSPPQKPAGTEEPGE